MFDWSTKRRLVRFCQIAEPVCNCIGLLALMHFTISLVPLEAILANPATGGDMGSHFWPLKVLVEHSLPDFRLRNLSPGNLGGEPQFVHYFPTPFLIMAFIAQIIPIGTAYNVGTLLPLVLFPVAVFCCIRHLGYRFPAPLISAGMSFFFLYNEAYSMWGGNALSLLAGQFAHLYALLFLLFGLAAVSWEIRKDQAPLCSAIMFAAVATSHGYVLVGVPFLAISIIFFSPFGTLRYRFWKMFYCGVYSTLLSVWFLIPMFENSKWNTPFSIEWFSKDIVADAITILFYPVLFVVPLVLVGVKLFAAFGIRPKSFSLVYRDAFFWGLPCLAYAGIYFILPGLGLVDTRAIPQVLLFMNLLSAVYLASCMRLAGRLSCILMVLPFVFLCVFWTQSNTTKVGHWLDWNYSGWKSKPLYQQLMALSDELDGDFSDTRVVYEHSVKNAHAGTIRVFEMLPYFTGRATLESVYLQATILAPMAWNIQAYVSKTPSCPFRQFSCPRYDLRAGLPRLYMLGVGDYIAVSEELRTQANILVEEGKLKRGKTFEPWEIFSLTDAPELAAVFDKAPEVISESNWRNAFISWFEEYQEGAAHQVVEGLLSESAIASLHKDSATKSFVWEDRDCRPKLEVDYGRLVLTTPCPGQAHFIRFAYHPAWWADSSDDLFPVSPGFIGLIPSKQTVVLSFGPQPLWILCGAISWIALVVLLFQSYHPCFSQVQRRAIEKPRA